MIHTTTKAFRLACVKSLTFPKIKKVYCSTSSFLRTVQWCIPQAHAQCGSVVHGSQSCCRGATQISWGVANQTAKQPFHWVHHFIYTRCTANVHRTPMPKRKKPSCSYTIMMAPLAISLAQTTKWRFHFIRQTSFDNSFTRERCQWNWKNYPSNTDFCIVWAIFWVWNISAISDVADSK